MARVLELREDGEIIDEILGDNEKAEASDKHPFVTFRQTFEKVHELLKVVKEDRSCHRCGKTFVEYKDEAIRTHA